MKNLYERKSSGNLAIFAAIRRASSRACVITITGGLITVGYARGPTKRVKPPCPQSLSLMMTKMS